MPLSRPHPPPNALEAVRRALPKRRSWSRGRRADPQPEITSPHRVFTARLDALADGRPLEQAGEETGWAFLIERQGKVVATAEAPRTAPGAAAAQLTTGPFAESMARAIRLAEELTVPEARDFEIWLFRAPALYLLSLWLRSQGDDVLIPLDPAPPPFDSGRSYSGQEFEQVVTDSARETLAAHSRIDRGETSGA